MNLIHTSDLHLVPDWFADTILENSYHDVFNEIADNVINEDSRYLLISGDFFDVHNPNLNIVLRVVRVLKRLKEKNIKVVVVPGNHDFLRIKSSILNLLNEAGLIHLLEFNEVENWLVVEPLVFQDDKIAFYGIPGFKGTSNREIKYLKDGLVKFTKESQLKDYTLVILAHLNTRFAEYDPSKYSRRYGHESLEYLEFLRRLPSNTRYVALGHVHIPIPFEDSFKGNIAYPGSPIGRDTADLIETYELMNRDIHRRILSVDISHDPPSVRSIRLENTPIVHYRRIDAKDFNDLKAQVDKALDEIELRKYTVLIVDVKGVEKSTRDIEAYRVDTMKRKNIFLKIRVFPRSILSLEQEQLTDIPVSDKDISIYELEEMILRTIIEKSSRKISYDKLKFIIDLISSENLSPEFILSTILREMDEK